MPKAKNSGGWPVVVFLMLYTFTAAGLALYGFNTLLIAWLYWRKRAANVAPPPLERMPHVTVQLPIYNELYVVERLIDAAAALDWQRDRLEIQVLDDSDDETTSLARARVEYYRAQGLDIRLIRRANRRDFKAGALAVGLARARGEFIAIFDADFVPPRDFLTKTIPHLLARPTLGLVQARWGHLNANYSPLTRAQQIALDGHFVVEQTARSRNGLFFNFNGTAGVWRRACIEDCGGWHGDTLSEDLDLSYRAQLRGWELLFLPDLVAPAEIPPQIHAFKRQQFRWAKGSTQCLMKLAPQLVAAPGVPLFKRVEGILHLSGYIVHPLMLLLILSLVPLLWVGEPIPQVLAYLSLAMLGPITGYALSQRALYPDWGARLRYFGFLMLIGTGIALNNTFAVLGALTRRGNTFRRTPKFRVEGDSGSWGSKRYALKLGWETIGELALAAYALLGVLVALQRDLLWSVPFLALYSASFAFTGALSLWHAVETLDFRSQIADYRVRVFPNHKS